MKSKKFVFLTIGITIILMVLLGAVTVVVDPFFHYHAPVSGLGYDLKSDRERYLNHGILSNYEYDAIIIGSSMTQNFKSSEFDDLFDVSSVKTSFSGAYNKEISTHLLTALKTHPDVKYVIWSLDFYNLLAEKDTENYDNTPDYLYDSNPWNDVEYLFNNDVLFNETLHTVHYSSLGKSTTSFDEYSNWMQGKSFGKAVVLDSYDRIPSNAEKQIFDEQDRIREKENILENIANIAQSYPNVQFYMFIPPYSIAWFDEHINDGTMWQIFDAMKYEVELLLPYQNIRLFCFLDDYDVTLDLDNYRDTGHYGEWVNSKILQQMKNGEHRLTTENFKDYFKNLEKFYLTYDYKSAVADK